MTMKSYKHTIALIALAAFVAPVYATGKPEPPKESPPTVIKQGQSQGQLQGQLQGQAQGQDQTQGQSQRAEAQALSNSESAASAGSTATSSSGGNSQSLSIANPRQAPAVAQGSFAIQGCGVAGNLGGSNTSGAGFLGFGFTPSQCYDFMLAQAYQALGAYQAACNVLNESKAGRRAAKRGVVLPSCEVPAPVAPPAPVVVNVTPPAADCTAQVDRAFKQCVAK